MAAFVLDDALRRTIGLLLETFAPEQCDRASAAATLESALGRLTEARRARLLLFARLLQTPLPAAMLLGRATPLAALDPAQRERLLFRLARSRVPALRSGFQAFKRLCLFMAYAALDARGSNPLWREIGYPGPRSDASYAPAPLASRGLGDMECDAVVVGSGAGGSVAAALLAARGARVVVLEAGPEAQIRNQREAEMMGAYYLDAALAATEDLSVSLLAGACVGGGTVVNWSTSLALPEPIAEQWSIASGGIDFAGDLRAHYEAVSQHLALARHEQHNANNAVIGRGAAALGWQWAANPRNAGECGTGCGYCGFGCCYGAKRDAAATFLSDAVRAGARVFAQTSVERVLLSADKVRGVSVTTTEDGVTRQATIAAPLVVVAAGSLRTPGILLRSGIRTPHVGKHLRLHPTSALLAEFAEPIEAWSGPMQTAYCDEFADMDGHYGVRFEAAPAHPGLAALSLGWRTAGEHAAMMRRFRNASATIVLTRDRGEGSVGGGDDRIRYRLADYDARHLLAGLGKLARLLFAAGALRVATLHTEPLELVRGDAGEHAIDAFAAQIEARGAQANRLALFSAHQMGTCRMHRSPGDGVVDERGMVHGIRGLAVADASVFPLSSGVNPMLTIMALAHRAATRWSS